MTRPNKIKCDGCDREVLLENAQDWTTVTIGTVGSPPTAPVMPGTPVQYLTPEGSGEASDVCSRKCHLKVAGEQFDRLVKWRKDQAATQAPPA